MTFSVHLCIIGCVFRAWTLRTRASSGLLQQAGICAHLYIMGVSYRMNLAHLCVPRAVAAGQNLCLPVHHLFRAWTLLTWASPGLRQQASTRHVAHAWSSRCRRKNAFTSSASGPLHWISMARSCSTGRSLCRIWQPWNHTHKTVGAMCWNSARGRSFTTTVQERQVTNLPEQQVQRSTEWVSPIQTTPQKTDHSTRLYKKHR